MNEQICASCGTQMKWVQAGISRSTGKPYNGFWSCPNRCPKTPYNAPTASIEPRYVPAPQKPPMSQNKPYTAKEKEDVDWDRISLGKCKTLFLLEAYKNGLELSKAEATAEEWARACMRILPKQLPQNFDPVPADDIPPF